ncbi:MAG: MBL fold metallo-hydrolase [Phycisphaerae bacterium]
MLTFSLQSGSNGNSIYVEAGAADKTVRLLFDAGITGAQSMKRMAVHQRSIRDVDAVLISHNHGDHVRYAGVLQRKFGLPLVMTEKTQDAIHTNLGKLSDVRHFESGESMTFGDVAVHTIRTPHDASDGVAFIVEHEEARLGIFTDLGHPFPGLLEALKSVDAAYLESNYDPTMLRNGYYPPELQARITGPGGHLSNAEAAQLVYDCGSSKPEWIALSHLSQDNNTPHIAEQTHRQILGDDFNVYHAPRYQVSDCWHVGKDQCEPQRLAQGA